RVRRDIAFGRQRVGHALAVVDIHLAAIGLDEDLLRRSRRRRLLLDERSGIHGALSSRCAGRFEALYRAPAQRRPGGGALRASMNISFTRRSTSCATALRLALLRYSTGSPKCTSTSTAPSFSSLMRCGNSGVSPIQVMRARSRRPIGIPWKRV